MRTKLIPSPHIEVQVWKCVCVPSTRRTGVEVYMHTQHGDESPHRCGSVHIPSTWRTGVEACAHTQHGEERQQDPGPHCTARLV